MAMDAARGHPRARLGDARPLLRSGRERRRPALGAHLRPRDEPGETLAHHLGRALQLTNILRDIDEDASDRAALSAARGAGRGGRCRPTSRSPRPRPEARREPASRWRRARAQHFEKARTDHGDRAEGGGESAATDGRRLRLDPRPDDRERVRAAAASRQGRAACACLARSCDTASG